MLSGEDIKTNGRLLSSEAYSLRKRRNGRIENDLWFTKEATRIPFKVLWNQRGELFTVQGGQRNVTFKKNSPKTFAGF